MVRIMKSSLKTAALAFLATVSVAWANPHITFVDSARHHEVNIGAQLADSLAITNLTNAPTHYDNSASVRFFLSGHFTERFLFNSRVQQGYRRSLLPPRRRHSLQHAEREQANVGLVCGKRKLRLGCGPAARRI